MQRFSLIVSLVILFIIGISVFFTQDPGILSFSWQRWKFEHPLWLILILAITGFWVCYFLFTIPTQLKTWWMIRSFKKKITLTEIQNHILAFEQSLTLFGLEQNWIQLYHVLHNTSPDLQKQSNPIILIHSYQQLFQNCPPVLATELPALRDHLPRGLRKQLDPLRPVSLLL